VDRVVPSPRLRPRYQPPETAEGSEEAPGEPPWGLERIGAPRVWSELGVRGAGVVVGQSDSGVQWDHPELRAAYRGTATDGSAVHAGNWLDPWEGRAEPYDRGGHGTHTLGSVLGQTVGVAPGATWFACANLVRDVGNAALYLDCMQFMLAPYPVGGDPFRDGDPTRSAHVTNNSWGCPRDLEGCDPNALLVAARALRAAGIFVVASAGNEGPGCSTIADPLALYDDVFTVGAIGPSGAITRFSSVGPVTVDGSNRPKPDLVAPGADVISAFPRGTYELADGTSMAGPHVVGVVALLWSANPALIGDVERTEDILRRSAAPYTPGSAPPDAAPAGSSIDNADDEDVLPAPQGVCADQVSTDTIPNSIVGYGIVDAYRAVKLALEQNSS
jgi:subtilisin family serine protease